MQTREEPPMGLEANGAGDFPAVSPSAYVHPSAVVIGNVQVEARAFIGPQAVIRADEPGPGGGVAPIVIREESNVQDGVVIHALSGAEVRIGTRTSIAHGAIVHGPCEIGCNCFVGFASVVFKAHLGDGVAVMHRALVQDVEIPDNRYVPSSLSVQSAEDVRQLISVPPEVAAFAREVTRMNVALAASARLHATHHR